MQKHNLTVLIFANFFVAASATMVLPFLSLYIETLGDFSDAYVQRWSGFIFGITFLVAFFVSPLWGRFGDRFGRKKILLITGFGVAISLFLMSFVTSVLQLFFLRMFMGVVTGFIPTSMALISAQTKKEDAGRVLGTLQMGTLSGGLFGPLFGGLLADSVGFIYTFSITAVGICLATILVGWGVHEIRTKKMVQKARKSMRDVIAFIWKDKLLVTIMLLSLIVQTATFSIQPQLALFVGTLLEGENIAFLAGLAFSITGLGNLTATRYLGILGDRHGHERVLIACMIAAAIFYSPQAFVDSYLQLVILRFLFGIAIGGIIPCVAAYIRLVTPTDIQGEVLGYNQSFRFLGNVTGPALGGLIAGYYGLAGVFYLATALLVVMAIYTLIVVIRQSKEERDHI
ncbi:MFS transporter [Paenalkalicoccus suaedae]|uniref:MFS transporter n=1 Tax=Paenalkalicoccus suaedae TaxID=2592382 RepID=A0A859FE53_9BACI|nr:MFS transporter [Paenalkalicoccus suaedae]QKS71160.1 MFS transporter [Paenalkalicoccus suaedae]